MPTLGYYNGTFADTDKLSLPFFSRSHFFGDGIYEACLCEGGRIMFLDEHIDRFFESAKALEIRLGFSAQELSEILYTLLEKSLLEKAFIYFSAIRGNGGTRMHSYGDEPCELIAYIEERERMDIHRELCAISGEDRRHAMCRYKTLSLLPGIMAARAASNAGVYECILLERGVEKTDAEVHEATHSNVHILKNGCLISPPPGDYVLDGISRRQLLRVARSLGIEVKEIPFTYKEMLDADEVILTCSSAVCQRISEIDGVRVSGKDTNTLCRLQNGVLELRK